MKVTAIIVAGGKGKRMGMGINKQYIKLKNKEILAYTLEKFENSNIIDEIVLVLPQDEIEFCKENIIKKYNIKKAKKLVQGGFERQESVYNGIKSLENSDIVLIHDGARPFVSEAIIENTVKSATKNGAASCAVKVKDTIKKGENGFFKSSLNRNELYSIQTPQVFKYDLILKAHNEALKDSFLGTDDTSLVERLGEMVAITEGDYFNIKITTTEDLLFGEAIINHINGGDL